MISGKNYIGNKLSAKGSKTYKTFNPQLNTENTAVFTEATNQEIDDAVNPFRQFYWLLSRYFKIKTNDRLNSAIMLLQAPIIALLICFIATSLTIVAALFFTTSTQFFTSTK